MRRFIIDTDAGVDDAMALIMALNSASTNTSTTTDPEHAALNEVKIQAILTSTGNTVADKVAVNVWRTLSAMGKEKDVPIHVGSSSVSFNGLPFPKLTQWFGSDGFNDKVFPNERSPPSIGELSSTETPQEATKRLVHKYPGEITYLALGPLTNLAKTFEQNPDLSSQLSEIVIMGGNSLAAAANQPEFNFQMDTASADYVLRNSECKTTLVTADFCEKISKSFEPTKLTGESENAKSFNFLTSISPLEDWAFYDQIAMAFILSGDYLKPVRIGITEINVDDRGLLTYESLNGDEANQSPKSSLLVGMDSELTEEYIYRGIGALS